MNKLVKAMLYQTAKTFLIFSVFLTLMLWFTSGKIYIDIVLEISLWMTTSIIVPIVLSLLILFPELDKQTPEERLNAFWEYHMPLKLISVLTISLAIFFTVLYLMVPMPMLGLTFWQVVAASLGIGFVFGILATLMAWGIIRLEKPPFQDLWWKG